MKEIQSVLRREIGQEAANLTQARPLVQATTKSVKKPCAECALGPVSLQNPTVSSFVSTLHPKMLLLVLVYCEAFEESAGNILVWQAVATS